MSTPLPNDPNGPRDDLQALAGEYVLGTLGAAEHQAAAQRLATDTALRQAVDAWEERLLPLTRLAEPVPLPAHLAARIEASLQDLHKPARAPARVSSGGWWNHLGLWRALAGSGFAMAAVLAAVLVTRTAPVAAPPQYLVVLVAPEDKAPGWVVQASSPRAISLIPLGVAQVPADKALEFWTKADGWNAPVSLGLVQPGRPLQVPLDRLPPLEPNQLFELTLEPATGSPVGRPTGPIQFIGRAVKVL